MTPPTDHTALKGLAEGATAAKRDRPTRDPGGCDCHDCGKTFIGGPGDYFCGICKARLEFQAAANPARILALLGELERMREALTWIALFADMRSKDDAKVFARVARGALRTIAQRALLSPKQNDGADHAG